MSPQRIPDCDAFLLCGGASRRMGRDKAMLDWNGQPLARAVGARLSTLFDRVALVVKEESMGRALGMEYVVDPLPDRHPAVGWLAALEATGAGWAFVMAVDLPLVRLELIEAAARQRATLPPRLPVMAQMQDGRWQPLLAFLPAQAAPELRRRLMAQPDLSLQRLCEALGAQPWAEALWSRLDPNRESLVNVNHPQDYRRAAAFAASGSWDSFPDEQGGDGSAP